jgi:flagellar motor switch protein FliM
LDLGLGDLLKTITDDEKEALYDAVLSLVDYSDEVEKEKNKYAEKKKFHALDFLREEDPKKEDIMVHSLAHRTVRRLVESGMHPTFQQRSCQTS